MKKIIYIIYVSVIVALLVCANMKIVSVDHVAIAMLVLVLIISLYCFGGSAPLRQYPVDMVESLKMNEERKNGPFLIKTYMMIAGPSMLALIITYFL